MEKLYKDILIRLRKNIIDDLDVDNDIIQPLRNEYIITEDHIKNIYIGATKEERAAKLLDILPLCGANAFGVFHQSLKHHYDWLSNEIDIMLGNYEKETNGVTDYYAGPLNIPPLSPLTVTRQEKLKKALQELIPTKYIALHGMKGFGKSSLVASTLKDVKLVKNLFSNQVYWIKFADDGSLDEEILIQLNTLYYNVRNLEIQPELFSSLERNSLIQYLKYYFNKQENCNALLILDDVHNEQIINTFDFQCKTLVLTDNIDVVLKKRPNIIEMNDGFTEAETLGLFAKALEMDVKKLPVEAKRIYEECKGMPLLIAMFAAQFEEFKCDMRIHDRRWKYYLKSLREKSRTNKVMNEFWKKQETIFDICIKQLKPNLKKYYEDLAIFCEDVNIASKTLEIFWRKGALEIEELMLDLCHKSLAARIWNNDLKTYIYGVHDLLLTHLRKKRTDDELIQMHKSIIEKYRQYCNNDFSKLPNDNYIYLYIGYHLEQAKLFEEFPRLYLNFDFIQAKLTHAGLNDLLLDLRKYRKYITLNSTDEYVVKVSDLERFLQEQASVIIEHKHKKCLDIIQIAMNHSSQDYITQTAKDLAMRRQEFLYLSHKKSSQHANISLTEEIPRNICTSSFTNNNPELVLTGNTSGKIILYDFQGTQRKIFNGHGEECSIKKIIVSMASDCFLSLSSAGIIKLFSLLEENDEFYQNYMNIGSPRQKQNFWSDPYSNLKGQDDSLAEFKVKNEIILDMAFGREENYIAACTNKATIQIWDRNGNTMFTLTDPKYQYIMKMAFTTNASLLHIMDESKGAFFVFTNYGNDYTTYQYVTCYNLQLKSASKEVIFFHHVPMHDDSLIVVTKKEAMYVKWCRRIENCVYNFNRKLKGYIDEKVTYVCATITYDGEYLILADSAGFINVWNTDSGFQPVAIYKSRVISLDSFPFKDCHVICGSGDGALYRWKLPIQTSNDLPRKCLFDAIVSCDEMDIVVKESPSKIITMSCGEKMIKESELIKGEISNLQLSADGTKALYVIDNKIIELLDITTGIITEVLQVDKPIQFVKIINLLNRDIILCRWEDDNLKIWQPPVVFGIETRGEESIHDIHIINDNCVITVMQNGKIKIWYTSIPWQLISQVDSNSPSNIIFSCLSYNQKYLAILNESHRLIVLYINSENIAASLPRIQITQQPYFTHTFAQKAICCDISKNEQYIAVGLDSGQISIINIQKRMEIAQLFFNASPITQLCWAPVTIDVPILLSLTSDELIWWNIALAKDMTRTQNMRNRISRSISAPSFSSNAFWNQRVPNSRSVDVNVSRIQNEMISSTASSDIINNISSYWKNKKGKNPEIPELLTVVALPQNRDGKICISPDFTKYVMVDMYGSINTFKLINYREFNLNIS